MHKRPADIRDKRLKVQQHHALGNSASEIMAKHLRGPNRLLPPGNPGATREPRFVDLPSESYHQMLNKVSEIKTKFAMLPARVRTMFGNDPGQMLRFIEKPENREKCVRLGLVPMTDEEFMRLSAEAEDVRKGFRKPQEPERGSHLPDPEAQPDFGGKGRQKPKSTPSKGGQGE